MFSVVGDGFGLFTWQDASEGSLTAPFLLFDVTETTYCVQTGCYFDEECNVKVISAISYLMRYLSWTRVSSLLKKFIKSCGRLIDVRYRVVFLVRADVTI